MNTFKSSLSKSDLTSKQFGHGVVNLGIDVIRAAGFVSLKLPTMFVGEVIDLGDACLRKAREQSDIRLGGSNPLDSKSIRKHYQDVHDSVGTVQKVLDGRLTPSDFAAKYLGHLTDAEADAWIRKFMGSEPSDVPPASFCTGNNS